MDIAEVKAFNSELSGLYDNKPPISKAKMSAITRGAIKAIKFYKHVVHSVEKFIQKCKPEYKIPGLYVIDSIVRQSRHQFGTDKDVFAPRFAKNLQQTFINLLRCPPEDKRNIIRVLNLWQKNSVFTAEVVQPLFDMVNPNHPIHQEILAQSNNANGSMNTSLHADPRTTPGPHASQHTPNDDQGNKADSIYTQLRQALRETTQSGSQGADKQSSANFNRRLLNVDFEYESEDEGTGAEKTANLNITTTAISTNDAQQQQASGGLLANSLQQMQQAPPTQSQQQQAMQQNYMLNPMQLVHNASADLGNLGSILTNPEILRHLQSLQAAQMMATNFPQLQGMNNMNLQQDLNYFDMTQPPPVFHTKEEQAAAATTTTNNTNASGKPKSPLMDEVNNESDIEFVDDAGPQVIEIDGNDSRSPTPKSIRRRRSRSRDRSKRSRSRSRRFSRSRSRDRRSKRSRDRDRDRERERDRDRSVKDRGRDRERDKERDKEKEKEREKERERKKKGLPPIKKETLSVCSTTLWVGHLSKLVQAEDLSDAFGLIGEVLSIDLVPPRGCAFIVMNRRRDAYKALIKLDKHKIHNKSITVAWAPGVGVKGREWKDYWEAEGGVCYVPWEKLPRPGAPNTTQLLDALEEGGMMDDETLPPWLHKKNMVTITSSADVTALTHPLLAAANTAAGMMVVPPLGQPPAPKLGVGVDATRLPASLGPLGFPPHPALPLPLLPLQAFKPQPQPGLQQALHLQAMLAHQQQHQQLAAQLLLGPPPRLSAQPTLQHTIPTVQQPLSSVTSETQKDDPMEIDNADDTPAPEINSKDNTPFSSGDNAPMSDKFKNLISQPPPAFNVPPPMMGQMPPNNSLPPTHIMPPNTSRMPPMHPTVNTSQPPPLFDKQSNSNNMNSNNNGSWDQQQRGDSKERDRDRRDRDGRRDRERRDRDGGRRDRHDRDRDGHRDRERGDMDRDRDRRERDRDRPERDRGRDKVSRWRDNSRERADMGPVPPIGERSLQDRLWEMANGPGARPRSDQSPPQHRSRERSRPKDGPSEGLLGEAPIPLSRALSPGAGPPLMGRSPLLPHMAPFRIGRDDIRMRGMGPRGPMGSMRPEWMDGPNPQFGPRFGGGPPPFNRPQFDGPPFRDGMDGPPFNGIKSRFERPPFDRKFDRPYDREYDRPPFDVRPPFDGMGRPPFDEPRRPAFNRGGPVFDEPYDDRPPFDGPPPRFNRSPYDDHDMDRPGPPRLIPPRGGRERDGRKRDTDRMSRWTGKESPERQEGPSSTALMELANKINEEGKRNAAMTASEPKVHNDNDKDISKEVIEKDVSPAVPNVIMDAAGDNVATASTEAKPIENIADKCENTNASNEGSSVISKPEVKAPLPSVTLDMFSDEPIVRNPTPEPVIRNSTPEPVVRNPTPEPIVRNPTSEPVVRNPTPEPIVKNPTPEPIVRNPTPEPIVRNPTPEPFVRNPTPEPFVRNPTPEPFVRNPTPEPFVRNPTPEPFVRNPTPEPFVRNPTPEPFVRNPTPEPVFTKPVETESKTSFSVEHKVHDIVAPPEVSIGTPAQRKFYEPIANVQDHRMNDDSKFSDSPSPPPVSGDYITRCSPAREDRPSVVIQNVVKENPVVINTQIETNVSPPPLVVESVAKPQPVRVEAEPAKETVQDTDGSKSQEGRSTPCRDEPSPTSVSEITEQTNP